MTRERCLHCGQAIVLTRHGYEHRRPQVGSQMFHAAQPAGQG